MNFSRKLLEIFLCLDFVMYHINYYVFTTIFVVFEYGIVSAYFRGHKFWVFPIVPLYK